jgi:chemotaxis family two-component system sensor kinase Cph1
MQLLIKALLSYSRVGRQELNWMPVSVENLLQHILESLRGRIEESGAEITHDPLPVVWSDSVQLGLVLQNLISNAIKFRGEEPLKIHISCEKEEEMWLFAVHDNGIGIDMNYQDRIFEVFKRLHSRRKYEGTGIGLAICKKIVERHGGRIWVESEPGRGSTFKFTLPDTQQNNGMP